MTAIDYKDSMLGGFINGTKNIKNCYYVNAYPSQYGISKTYEQFQTLASTLGTNWIDDGKIKNEDGEWIDNLDENGNKIFINNGYPILKWQLEK